MQGRVLFRFSFCAILFVNVRCAEEFGYEIPYIMSTITWKTTDSITIARMCIDHASSSSANASNLRLRWMFSNELKFQTFNENIFEGSISSLAAVFPTFVKLAEPVATRYIQILPQKQSDGYHRVMRLEVYGCLAEPMPSYTVPYDFSRRSYLLNSLTGDFYVCLYGDDRHDSSCKYTKDGYNWKKLNKRIIKVLAVDSSNFALYGLDRSNSYLQSTGNDWTVISRKQWEKVKVSQRVILAKVVPENLLRKEHIGGEILESQNGYHWTVSHADVDMKNPGGNWVIVATWKC